MKDTKPTPAGAEPSGSGIAGRGRPSIALVLAGAVFIAAAGWAAFDYWESLQRKSEILVYHLCVATDQKLCPGGATYGEIVPCAGCLIRAEITSRADFSFL